MAVESTTPLIALDAVVIDTETTGLDPRKAWVVEIAALRLAGGDIEAATSLRRRIRPPSPIPERATRVHGIEDVAVSDAPACAEVWPEFTDFIADSVVIGHSIGFDLAVLKRECERASIRWVHPRALDTGLLGAIVSP